MSDRRETGLTGDGQSQWPRRRAATRGLRLAGAIIFGVLLPVAVLIVELVSKVCAESYVDPIPSLPHILMVAWVPLANALALVMVHRRDARFVRETDWATSIAMGISLYYALVFLPVTPFAVIGIIFYGIGFLPLSPLLALLTTFLLRRRLKRRLAPMLPHPPFRHAWRGMACALSLVVLLAMPATVALVGARMATSRDAGLSRSGLTMLRRFGSHKALLRMCYVRNGLAKDPLGFILNETGRRISTTQARRLYYRVTGSPFNAVPPPRVRGVTGRSAIVTAFDFDQGGDAVRARVRGLSMEESRLETSIEPLGCHAYTEWTMVFQNSAANQQEARAKIALPPGGVVSRLTLWINGEEREAAFGPRGKVREAYQRVVRRRRDPVLVTTAGSDRVLMQCFPVPPPVAGP